MRAVVFSGTRMGFPHFVGRVPDELVKCVTEKGVTRKVASSEKSLATVPPDLGCAFSWIRA